MKDARLKQGQYSLAEALELFFSKHRLSDKMTLSQIKHNWPHIAGQTIANYTTDLYLSKKTLYIKVNNSHLKQELHYMKDAIKKAVNAHFNKETIIEIIIN
jgi:hypothetical protein